MSHSRILYLSFETDHYAELSFTAEFNNGFNPTEKVPLKFGLSLMLLNVYCVAKAEKKQVCSAEMAVRYAALCACRKVHT